MKELRKLYGNKYLNQKEWADDPDHVYIGRARSVIIKDKTGTTRWPAASSPFHNPYTVADHGREQALVLYKQYIIDKLQDPEFHLELKSLKGKTLGCWCKPESCHGDILLELLNMI